MIQLTKENVTTGGIIRRQRNHNHGTWEIVTIEPDSWVIQNIISGKKNRVDPKNACEWELATSPPEPPLIALGPDSTDQTHPAVLPTDLPEGWTRADRAVAEPFDSRKLEGLVESSIDRLQGVQANIQDSESYAAELADAVMIRLQEMQTILHTPIKTVQVRKISEADALRMILRNMGGCSLSGQLAMILNQHAELRDNVTVRYEVQE